MGLKTIPVLGRPVPRAFIVILCGFSKLSYGSSYLHLFPLWTQSAVPFHALVSRSQPLYSHTVVLQLLSLVLLFVTSWTAACQVSLSFTISWSLLKLMSVESVMPSNQLILCCPLLLRPSIFPSIRVFSNESALHIRWSKDWSFSFSLSPSHENSGLISFRIDWFDLLAVQGTLNHLHLQPSITTIF